MYVFIPTLRKPASTLLICETDNPVISLNNISILNQNEYLSLYSHLISLCSSSNFTIRFMGACYLILMHEKNPILFKNNFLSAFKMSEISVKSPDYDDDFYPW